MRNEFDDVYKHIIDSYEDARESSSFQKRTYVDTKIKTSLLVHELVNEFKESGISIRNDAIHFLIINLHQLIALPLALEHGFEKDVFNTLTIDTKSIFNEAIRVSKHKLEYKKDKVAYNDRDTNELILTGGDMLKAVANIYDDLSLSQVKLWGG